VVSGRGLRRSSAAFPFIFSGPSNRKVCFARARQRRIWWCWTQPPLRPWQWIGRLIKCWVKYFASFLWCH
jgi:hypothetical protein